MELGQTIIISSRLVLGTAASFLAIMLLSKTKDAAWILVITGTITTYIETVNSVLDYFGMGSGKILQIGSTPILAIVLPALSVLFYISAFAVMVARKYRR